MEDKALDQLQKTLEDAVRDLRNSRAASRVGAHDSASRLLAKTIVAVREAADQVRRAGY